MQLRHFLWPLACLPILLACKRTDSSHSGALALLLGSASSGAHTLSQSVSILDGSGTGALCPTGCVEGTAPYFVATSLTPAQLADPVTFPNQFTKSGVAITTRNGAATLETADFTGVPLADVLIRGAKFRPNDKGKDGRATIITAEGTDGYRAVFSFTELVKTSAGPQTLVVYKKNGGPLTSSEGMIALLPAGDTHNGLRYVRWLKSLTVENFWVTQTTGSATSSFTISGDVNTPINVDATTFTSGSPPATRYFQNVGPTSGSGNYYWGQGVQFGDLLTLAGMKYPTDYNRCYTLVETPDHYRVTFSCSEIFNSAIGTGDNNTTRSRRQGIVVVDPNAAFLSGTGTTPASCLSDPTSGSGICDVAGDPSSASSYVSNKSGEFIKIISTADTVPFAYPGTTPIVNVGGRAIAWAQSVTVTYK